MTTLLESRYVYEFMCIRVTRLGILSITRHISDVHMNDTFDAYCPIIAAGRELLAARNQCVSFNSKS
jgi:hypothetical protein